MEVLDTVIGMLHRRPLLAILGRRGPPLTHWHPIYLADKHSICRGLGHRYALVTRDGGGVGWDPVCEKIESVGLSQFTKDCCKHELT